MVYRVLLNDGMHREGLRLFKDAGIKQDTTKRNLDELINDIGNFDAIAVRSATKVTKEVIEAGHKGNLKLIGRAGIGYDNIDVDVAYKCGIPVVIAPHGNTPSTANLAFTGILTLSRRIAQLYPPLISDGTWLKIPELQGTDISGKTLGIIGTGRIGRALGKRALAFDMRVIGYDTSSRVMRTLFEDSGIEPVEKDYLVKESDFISIHTGGKQIVVGEPELSLMKPTTYIINVSRGDNVDDSALLNVLLEDKIAGAFLDAHKNEPKEKGKKLESIFVGNKQLEGKNIILTPHIGALTAEAQKGTSKEMAGVIVDYLIRGTLSNAVDLIDTIRDVE